MARPAAAALLCLLLAVVVAHAAPRLRRIFNDEGYDASGSYLSPWAGPAPDSSSSSGPGLHINLGRPGTGFHLNLGGGHDTRTPGIDLNFAPPEGEDAEGSDTDSTSPEALPPPGTPLNISAEQLSQEIAGAADNISDVAQDLSDVIAKGNRTDITRAIGLAQEKNPDTTSSVISLTLKYSAVSGQALSVAAVIVEASAQGGSSSQAISSGISKSISYHSCTYLGYTLWFAQIIATNNNVTQAFFNTLGQADALSCLRWPHHGIAPSPMAFPTEPPTEPPPPNAPSTPPPPGGNAPSACPGETFTLDHPIPFGPPGLIIGPATAAACVNLSDSGSYMSGVGINAGSALPSRPFLLSSTDTQSAWVMAVVDAGFIKMVGLQVGLSSWRGATGVYADGARYKEAAGTSTPALSPDLVLDAWENNTGFAPEGILGYVVSTLAVTV